MKYQLIFEFNLKNQCHKRAIICPCFINALRRSAFAITQGINARWDDWHIIRETKSTTSAVAHNFRVHRKTIVRLVRKRLATGTVKNLPRPWRLRVTTAAEDRAIRTAHLRRRFQTAAATSTRWVSGHVIGRHTVRRRLKDGGILCKRPINRNDLQQQHRASRLARATHHVRWTLQQLTGILSK